MSRYLACFIRILSAYSKKIQEIDKKKKKKKGTLGIGNGSIFFASESDKVSNTTQ